VNSSQHSNVDTHLDILTRNMSKKYTPDTPVCTMAWFSNNLMEMGLKKLYHVTD